MLRRLLPLLLAASLQALQPLSQEEALDLLKNSLKADFQLDEAERLLKPSGRQCLGGQEPEESSHKVFISFSVPESIWLSLSREMEAHGASFVLRGLPKNSFRELASRVLKLRKSGLRAPVLVSPFEFERHRVDKVPAFLFYEGEEEFKLSGSVSFGYALEKFLSERSRGD